MKLYGREWSRRELEARVGRIEQIAGIRRWVAAEGREAGVEQLHVRTGAGLSYWVTPTKGLDIAMADYCGVPISWQSCNGDVHPRYYEAQGDGWLRTASGGLLMTCGMMQVGSACEDEGEPLGLHGRAHHTPARQVTAASNWDGDEMEMRITGIVEEASLFGGYLRLTRRISSFLGQNSIRIEDEVRNMGFRRCPHMMLYHFNFGFPLMDENTAIRFPAANVRAREPQTPVDGYDTWQVPDPDYQERVYLHAGVTDPAVRIVNRNFPLPDGGRQVEAVLRWSADTLPNLLQWKMPGAGMHVLGIEPANCGVAGRAMERKRGTLVFLEPGETVNYRLELNLA
ncbi:aldose 1-epimerase family protein [Paenibacillus tyrfis]|uniref:aldose 1-epimerase family protein n=1 Tax=Paenibacillus tyrfis TaxID=1501230 RepID=UPI000B593221|nr:aldose 1-epimerase family protein [Paenibacillus tyrfis]